MAPEKKDEKIDLRNLKQRELLILLANNVERLEEQAEKTQECVQTMMLKVNTLETRSKLSGSIWGSVTGLVTAIIAILIERLLST